MLAGKIFTLRRGVEEVNLCSQCKQYSDAGSRFCTNCGAPIVVAAPTPPPPPPVPGNEVPQFDNPGQYYAPREKKPFPKKAVLGVISGVAVIALIGTIIGIVNAPKVFEETLAADEITTVTSMICGAVVSELKTSKYYSLASSAPAKTKTLNGVSGDSYDAQDFKYSHAAWFEQTSIYDEFNSAIADSVATHGPELFAKYQQGKYEGAYSKNSLTWNAAMLDGVNSNCSINKVQKILWRYQTALNETADSAANAPWYPRGYSSTSVNEDVAWAPNHGYCSYSWGSCARFKLISRTDCYSSLYVEANLTSGGTVVDWGNDTARVGAYQPVNMEITFTSERSGTYEFTKISCY
jgi:hypothetical protein